MCIVLDTDQTKSVMPLMVSGSDSILLYWMKSSWQRDSEPTSSGNIAISLLEKLAVSAESAHPPIYCKKG